MTYTQVLNRGPVASALLSTETVAPRALAVYPPAYTDQSSTA